MPILSGWMRIVLFLLVYLLLQMTIALLQPGLFLHFTCSFLLSLLLVGIFTVSIDQQKLSVLGFQSRGAASEAILGALTAISMLAIICLTMMAAHQLRYTGFHFAATSFFSSLVLMIMVALAEELVFRGYILRNLLRFMRPYVALLLSALVFAIFHAANPGASWLPMLNVFLAGCLLGIRYIFNRGLWFGICLHFCWNFLQGPVLGYAVSGLTLPSFCSAEFGNNTLLTGGEFGIEGSVITTATLILLVLLFARFTANKQVDL